MVETLHPKTGVIREIIKTAEALYGGPSFHVEMNNPLCRFGRRTLRELINSGQADTVLADLRTAFENQGI